MTWERWPQAWQDALYGPDGFYRRAEGPAGHFATSAQGLGTGTGGLLAEAVTALVRRHGLSRVVEVGAGRGELLAALSRHPVPAGTDRPVLHGLDVTGRPPGLPSEVGWSTSPGGPALPGTLRGLRGTLLLAHEWLDVVPCLVAARDDRGRWRTVEVERSSGRERAGEPLGRTALAWVRQHARDARRVEVGLARDAAYADLVGRVEDGLVVAVDYGHTAADRPPWGTLTAFRAGVQVAPLPDGSCDLTAHVAVDTLAADRLLTQRAMLHELLGRAAPPSPALSRTDPGSYLAALGRSSALAALTDPRGLGGFWWALTGRGTVRLG